MTLELKKIIPTMNGKKKEIEFYHSLKLPLIINDIIN